MAFECTEYLVNIIQVVQRRFVKPLRFGDFQVSKIDIDGFVFLLFSHPLAARHPVHHDVQRHRVQEPDEQ